MPSCVVQLHTRLPCPSPSPGVCPSSCSLSQWVVLHSSWVAYWTPSDLGRSYRCHIFLPFYTFHGVLTASTLEWLPSLPPVDHVLSELSAVTILSGWPHIAWLIACLSYTSPFVKGTHPWRGMPSCFVLNTCLDVGYLFSATRCSSATQPPLVAFTVIQVYAPPVLKKLKLNSSMKTYKTF